MSEPPFEIREIAEPDGGFCLELHVEGGRISSARAGGDGLMEAFGSNRAGVRALLERALLAELDIALTRVELAPCRQMGAGDGSGRGGQRFVSGYVHRDAGVITAGVVWYDATSNTTGGQSVHPLVRSKMRATVNRKLEEKRPTAWRFVVDLLDGMSS